MIIILDDENHLTQKRQFTKINLDIIKSLKKNYKTNFSKKIISIYGEGYVNQYIEKLSSLNENEIEIDVITGRFKHDILNDIKQKLEQMEIPELEAQLLEYSKEFNLSSGIYYNLQNELCTRDKASGMISLYNINYQTEINTKHKKLDYEFVKFKKILYQVYQIIVPDTERNKTEEQMELLIDSINKKLSTESDVVDYLETNMFSIFQSDFTEIIYNRLRSLLDTNTLNEYNRKIINMNILDNYFEERISEIEISLNVEDLKESSKIDEKQFRLSQIKDSKQNSILSILINVANMIITSISKIKNDHRYYLQNGLFRRQPDDFIRNICLDSGCSNDNEIEILSNSLRLNNKIVINILNASQYQSENDLWVNCSNDINVLSNIMDTIVSYTNNPQEQHIVISLTYQKLVTVIIRFLLSKICVNRIFDDEYTRDLFNNINTLITIYDYTDSEIEDNLKNYRADENRMRKVRFERLSEETKSSQRLLRQFNAAAMFHQEEYEQTVSLAEDSSNVHEQTPLISRDQPGEDDNEEYHHS